MQDAQTMQPAGLSAKGLSKSFGALRVLHEVDFEVRPGEDLGIPGPNGAGKTTLFNLISGDLRSDNGSLRFGEVTLKSQPPFRRCQPGIGRTYQIPKPCSGMTTFENLPVAASFGGQRSMADSYALCAAMLHRRAAPPCCATANSWTRPTRWRGR